MQDREQVRRDLRRQLGREPEIQELARALYPEAAWQPSYEPAMTELPDSTLALQQKMDEVMQNLDARQRAILRFRFGLTDGRPQTLEEVAEYFSISRDEVRRIEARALRKLRHPKGLAGPNPRAAPAATSPAPPELPASAPAPGPPET
ncbi:MAG: hypothetical protein J0I12_18235 [Candidatus Eremiobacteraeota bacterium]|nr:hypothetical protein [Candidatus Eremiobacteraeota bacterium]